SDQVFSDSIKATVSLRDKSNKLYTIPIRKLKKLNPGDTAIIDVTIPGNYTLYNEDKVESEKILFGTSMLGGLNTLNISINPDDNPMENSLINNVLQRNIFIQSTALPVVFGNFTVALMQGNKAFVKWNTLTELNSDYYTIQRSVDGKSFMDIGKKKSMGNSVIGALYSFIDNLDQVPKRQGVLYYRIAETDLNGHNFYSKIVTVHPLMSSWGYKIAPNPVVQDQINLTFEAPEASDVLVRLMNMSGSVLLNNSYSLNGGTILRINTPHLVPGIYILQVKQGRNEIEQKLIKK
ncbi:MAG TPA: T9SS type A sorting domain-containing protein, partial [Arachidicoccus sp.]|nr:T9SS type A sorting domain-containing protein [Arachidicoccus sp.]